MPEPITPEEDMLKACMCLRLEVPKIIADDVEAKAKHLIADRDSWKKLAEIVSESRDKAFARVEELETELAKATKRVMLDAVDLHNLRARVEELEVSARQMSTHIDRESESWVAEHAELLAERGALKRRVGDLEKALQEIHDAVPVMDVKKAVAVPPEHPNDHHSYLDAAMAYEFEPSKVRALARAALGKEG